VGRGVLDVVGEVGGANLKQDVLVLISLLGGVLRAVRQRVQLAAYFQGYLLSCEMVLRESGLSGALGSISLCDS
jgi:hypothetical protein